MRNLSASELQCLSASIALSQEQDAAWLSQVFCHEKPVEWAGFHAQKECEDGTIGQKPKTTFVFGPMIDSPPAHPDTALTTLKHLKKCLTAFGIDYIRVTIDMQLYQVMCMIKWSDPKTWTNLVLHPGIMHALRSFFSYRDTDEIIRLERNNQC